LCRPIFKEVVSANDADSSSSLEDSTSTSGSIDQDQHNKPILVTATKQKVVQRTERSYGGRKRPYVMLELDLLQDNSSSILSMMDTTSSKPKEIVEQDNEPLSLPPLPFTPPANTSTSLPLPRRVSTSLVVVEDPVTDSTCNSSSSGEKTSTATRTKHRGLFQGKTKRERRCADTRSTSMDSLAQIVVAEPCVPEPSNRTDNNKKKATVLDFAADDEEAPPAATVTKEPELFAHQPNSNTGLLQARSFFERLDATQELKLDSSDTPVATSGKVSRTSRRRQILLSCSSPTVLQDYQAYRRGSNESGVTPLSLPNFLRSRSIHKSELYDGFLDEEEE
jgi:hypothetical protein